MSSLWCRHVISPTVLWVKQLRAPFFQLLDHRSAAGYNAAGLARRNGEVDGAADCSGLLRQSVRALYVTADAQMARLEEENKGLIAQLQAARCICRPLACRTLCMPLICRFRV